MISRRLLTQSLRALIQRIDRALRLSQTLSLWTNSGRLISGIFRKALGQPIRFCDREGFVFFTDNIQRQRWYLKNGTVLNERSTLDYIRSVLHAGSILVDIGANVGGISVACARNVQPNGRVVALEAEATNFEMLLRAIEENGLLDTVFAYHAAVFSRDGVVQLNAFDSNQPEWHSIGWFELGGYRPTHVESVEAVRLDSFCRNHRVEHIDVLKVDVEGAEPDVFIGAKELISQHRIDRIVFEISKVPMEGMGYQVDDVVTPLVREGYRVSCIEGAGLVPASDELLGNTSYGNFVAVSPKIAG